MMKKIFAVLASLVASTLAFGQAAVTRGGAGGLTVQQSSLIFNTPIFVAPALGTPASGVGTNITGVNAATLGGATFAAPGAIGGTTPGSGAFTTINATGSITGQSNNNAFGASAATAANIGIRNQSAITASSGTARAYASVGALTTAANSNLLAGLVIGNTFSNGGAFTNVRGIQVYVPATSFTGLAFGNGIYIENITGATNNYALQTNSGLIVFGDTTEATTGGAGSVTTAGGIYAAKKIITSSQLVSDVVTGTPPLVVASTTNVPNLYVARATLADSVTTIANLTGAVTSVGNATSLGSFTFSALNTALTGDDAAGLAANNAFTGINSQSGAAVTTANAMGGTVIDVTKSLNTVSIATPTTYTFSGTPANTNQWFSLLITADSTARVATIPSSFSVSRNAAITTVTVPASGKVLLTWQYNGSIYNLYGDPVVTTGTGSFVLDTSPTITTPVIASGLTASGSGANTFAGSSGSFITSTGANTISGAATFNSTIALGGTALTFGALPSGATTAGTLGTYAAQTYTVTGTNTATAFQAIYHGAPTFTDASAGTVTDLFSENWAGPPVAAGSLTATRVHTLGVLSSTSASSSITGSVIIAATYGTAATSVGIGGGNVNAGTSVTAATSFLPAANDGAALGTTALQFSDLFLAEGGVINFDNGDATITQSGNTLTVAGAEWIIDAASGPTSTVAGGFRGMPQNSQSAAYTTILADAGKHVLHPTADNNARTITIDSNANVAYPIGTVITIVNQINTVTISITSDTLTWFAGSGTASTGSRTLAAGGVATLLKVSSTGWIISGPGVSFNFKADLNPFRLAA